VSHDAWGSYTDPYAYGGIPNGDLGYPLRPYTGADDMYDYATGGDMGAYDSNAVTYDTMSYGNSDSVDAIAIANLSRATSRSTQYSGSSMGGRGGSTGGVRLAQTNTAKKGTPSCTLIPRTTNSNSVVLEWQTIGASSAFIDNGVGHVVLGTGTRTVTPRVTTTYNMTVVDGRGFASQCAAIVHVLNSGKVDAATTIVPGVGASMKDGSTMTDQATTLTDENAVNTDSSSSDPIADAAGTVTKIGGNVSDKVTSVLSTGEGVWDKMRQMSVVAIGLFFVIFIIMFVMRKMFGGGDEAAH
jgi:hypothetical protein